MQIRPPRLRFASTLAACLLACGTTASDSGEIEDSTSTGDSGSPTPYDCASWCAGMEATCPEEALLKEGACMAWCEAPTAPVPLGTAADRDVDTLGCRVHWLEQAAAATTESDRLVACASASPSGGDTCGSWCDVYCRQGVATCSGANDAFLEGQRTWFDEDPDADPNAVCAAACPSFATDVLPGVSQTDQQFGYGDTVQCRLHHQQAAMIEGPQQASNYGLHCGHAAIEPMELCLDTTRPNTVNYCEFALDFCPDLFPAGATALDCRATLDALVSGGTYVQAPFQSFTDQDGNSLGCLNHWVMAAPVDPSACAKADWDPANWVSAGGAGVCQAP